MVAHVITFEVGAVLDDPHWQAPVYCFNQPDNRRRSNLLDLGSVVIAGSPGTLTSEIGRLAYAK